MTDKKDIYETLGNWIDAVASEEENDRDYFNNYNIQKTPQVLESTGKIKFNGDDVMVGDKKVGQIKSSSEEEDSGFDFVSEDGKFSEKFDTVEEIYEFLYRNYNVSENTIRLNETKILRVEEGRVEDAVYKQPAMKSDRAKRWEQVRGKKQPDGTPGDYESSDTKGYDDKIKGKSDDPAYDGHGKDSRHLKGYYDSHDPRKVHKDPHRGGSNPAHDNAASDLDTKGGYDSHDVRKEHNK